MRIKTISLLLCSFLTIGMGKTGLAADLQGKLVLSAKGGMCRSMPEGLSFAADNNGNYGLGLSVEYFFLEPLSGGLSFSYNSFSFEGEWARPAYYSVWNYHYYTDWTWSNVSIFGRFVLAPLNEVSPYFTAGIGLYIPRIKNKSYYYQPDTIYANTFYGKSKFGYHFGFGTHYLLSSRVLVYLEFPLNVIKDEDNTHYFNIFAGISFLLGPAKQAEETRLIP